MLTHELEAAPGRFPSWMRPENQRVNNAVQAVSAAIRNSVLRGDLDARHAANRAHFETLSPLEDLHRPRAGEWIEIRGRRYHRPFRIHTTSPKGVHLQYGLVLGWATWADYVTAGKIRSLSKEAQYEKTLDQLTDLLRGLFNG